MSIAVVLISPCLTLFGRINLNIEPVKTEAMHFHPIRRVTGYHNWKTAGVRIAPDTYRYHLTVPS